MFAMKITDLSIVLSNLFSIFALQLSNKGEATKPEFEAFKGSGKTLRQKRKN